MFESLFGAEMPLAVRFFVAFLIVLALIGAIAWAVRRFGSGRLGASTRGRQPRLAVIDYASVDGRRRLILVRRDNVEHLLMIGGPSDIVVEANGGSRPDARNEPPHEDLPGRPQSETSARQRDTLAALADELSTRGSSPQRSRGISGEPPRQEQRQEGRPEARQETRQQRAEPRLEPRKPPQPAATSPAPSPSVTPNPATATPATADQSLADMAQRLEAALRKPPGEARPAGGQARSAPAADQTPRSEALPTPPPRPARPGEQRPPAAEASKTNQNKTAIYDTLEQEMANLLGRPSKS